MNFWQLTKESVYSPEFYASLRKNTFRFSDAYLLKLLSVFALVVTALVAPVFLTFINTAQASFEKNLESRIPDDFLFTIKNGAAITNLDQPFYIPDKLITVDDGSGKKRHVVTIDTRVGFTPEQFAVRNSLYWVAKDGVVSQGDGKIDFSSFKDLDADISVSKADIVAWSRFGGNIATFLRYFIVPVAFLAILIYNLLAYTIYLLFGALIVWGIGKFNGKKFTFGESYRYGMHLITLPLAIHFLLWLLGVPLPFVFTIVFAAVAWVNLGEVASPKPRR